ncbi:tetratricopeptide repeat protein [Pelomonas sp. SE-A7]|uniref:tetratricopeptide repeat protein n=1 Tax=Pelomonas sp. SE-A7 TaxID=3054953 RepID=UPI00259C80CF|nr:tetratricopeptide repeat protein [Pelomonas sp. SE-A7]MDM4768339.1 tetratricopeptide repeat protein [Pelomonas sp. SE-A7]
MRNGTTTFRPSGAWRGLLLGLLMLLSVAAFAGAKEEIQTHMRAGRWEAADRQLVQVLDKHPDNALAHYWRAQTQLKLGHADQAKSELAKAVELDPAEKFAGDKAALAKLKSRLDLGQTRVAAAEEPARAQVQQEPAARVEAPQPTAQAPVERERRRSGFGFWMLLLVGVGFVGPLAYLFIRKQKNEQLSVDRDLWRGRLKEASGDLDNALRFSDASDQLSPEAKLGNYDRVRQAKAEIDGLIASLPSAQDFDQTARVVERSKDLAADLRGEPRPSDIRREQEAANLAYERDMRTRQMEARANQPAVFNQGAGVGSVLPTVAAAAVGLAIGSAMSNAHGRSRDDEDEMRRRDAEYDRLSGGSNLGSGGGDFGGSDLDLGGGGDSSSDWSGGADTGGSSDASFD